MNDINPKVDAFLERAEKWQTEFQKLRSIVLASGLNEELKWGSRVTRSRKETWS